MDNFSISKSHSAASTDTITFGSSQLGTVAGQHPRGSFVGLSTTVHTPESTLISATYYQQDESGLLSGSRILSGTNAPQVDPFKALATHPTVTFEDQNQAQEQPDEFPLPFEELLKAVDDFDPMASGDPDDVNLTTLPNKNDERIRKRTTISTPKHEISPSNNDQFQQALTGIAPEALLVGITEDPKLQSSRPQAHQGHNPTDKWIVLTGDKKKPFECGYEGCGKRYTRKNDLRLHFIKHTGDSPYRCYMGECTGEVAFRRQYELNRHTRAVHSKEKSFQCDICKNRFGRRDNLFRHRRNIHSKQN